MKNEYKPIKPMKEVPNQLRKLRRQFLRYQQAEIVYSLPHKKLFELASDAGAIYRFDSTVLITLTRTIIKQDQYGNEYAGNAVSARYTKTITLPNGASGFQGWYKDGEDAYGNVEWASLLYRMDWEELYDIVDGIKCRATGSGMTEEELRQLFTSLNIDATTARGQVVAFALSCQGKFVYAQPSSLRGGPGNPSVGINLDCSSFVQYCYWAQNLPFSAGSTAAYRNAADLVSVSPSEVQPGDLRVVYASGGEQGHVQMALGGGAWIECCYGYGVAVNMSNAWIESRPCYYFRYAGF